MRAQHLGAAHQRAEVVRVGDAVQQQEQQRLQNEITLNSANVTIGGTVPVTFTGTGTLVGNSTLTISNTAGTSFNGQLTDGGVANPGGAGQLPGLLEGRARTLETLLHLLGTSQFFSDLLVANPDYLDLIRLPLRRSPSQKEMQKELQNEVDNAFEDSAVLRAFRRFRQHHFVRIGTNDIIRERPLEEVTRDISRVADAALEIAAPGMSLGAKDVAARVQRLQSFEGCLQPVRERLVGRVHAGKQGVTAGGRHLAGIEHRTRRRR